MITYCIRCGEDVPERSGMIDRGLLFCSLRCALQSAPAPPIVIRDKRTREATMTVLVTLTPKIGYMKQPPIDVRLRAEKAAYHRTLRKRRLDRAQLDGSHTRGEWVQLCRRYRWRCLACQKRGNLTKDHIRPLSRGGSDHISNIQPLCASCNSAKGTRIIDYRPVRL